MRYLGGHLGAHTSALVDGQMQGREADRAWLHVETCSSCRETVERETWVKDRLLLMGSTGPSARLSESLAALCAGRTAEVGDDSSERVSAAWATVGELERRHRGRRAGLLVAGAGSVSAAVVGLVALGALPTDADRPAPRQAQVSGGVSPAADRGPTVLSPLAPVARPVLRLR